MNVLFLTHRLPYAPNRGDRARAHHIIKLLAPRVSLQLISLAHDHAEMAQAGAVQALGAAVSVYQVPQAKNRIKALPQLAGSTPLTHLLLDAPGIKEGIASAVAARKPDVVLAYCSSMAKFAMQPPLAGIPMVLDMVDVDSEKWAALSHSASGPMRWVYRREARVLRAFEGEACRAARHTVVVSRRELKTLREIAPEATSSVLELGVDEGHLRPHGAPTGEPRVVFCGVMNYTPNIEGIVWFAREVWPKVTAVRPDARFSVVGADPVGSIRRLAVRDATIDVTGTVPDVRQFLWEAAVSVAPLQTAPGVQNKVLEALGAHLPVVATTPVAAGLPSAVLPVIRVADAPEAFARHIVDLLAMRPADRRAFAEQASLDLLTWERQLEPLWPILLDAVATRC